MECQEQFALLLCLVVLAERPESPNNGITCLHELPDANTPVCFIVINQTFYHAEEC